jgi:hypothetical protein
MRIIYDSKAPAHRTVQFEDDDGTLHPIPSYVIKIQDVSGLVAEFSRWGNAKRRKAHLLAVVGVVSNETKA